MGGSKFVTGDVTIGQVTKLNRIWLDVTSFGDHLRIRAYGWHGDMIIQPHAAGALLPLIRRTVRITGITSSQFLHALKTTLDTCTHYVPVVLVLVPCV